MSRAQQGPRCDPLFSLGDVDEAANLLLLCGMHHKMVDDQYETYSSDVLRNIKVNHEKWVESKFKDEASLPPVRIRRIKENIPTQLQLVSSGRDMFSLASSCHGMYQHYADNLSGDEVELVGGFLQNLKDFVDLASDLEPLDQVRAGQSIDEDFKSLAAHGFLVFAAIEKQRLEGGVSPSSTFRVLHVSIARASDASVTWSSGKEAEQSTEADRR